MSAELDYSQLLPEFDDESMRGYLESQLALQDGQRVAGFAATNLEHIDAYQRRVKAGVRLSCTIMGLNVEDSHQLVDVYPDEDIYHNAAHDYAKQLAAETSRQREVTWVGSVGFERFVEKPKPTIVIREDLTSPKKGW